MSDSSDKWYWDLQLNKAVPAAERGAGDHILGPYSSKFEAQNWKERVEERNEEWAGADEEWDEAGDTAKPDPSTD
jgi:hypothetical protein